MDEKFAKLINLLWRECIENLNSNLEQEEQVRFSNNDYYYLLIIQSMDHPILSDIAQRLNMTKPAITGIINKLQGMDLVRKTQSRTDKRRYTVSLTVKGEKLLSGDRAIYKWVTDTMDSLCRNEEEKKLVEYMINELVRRLEGEQNDFLL